jgi:hypothetical protein
VKDIYDDDDDDESFVIKCVLVEKESERES